MGLDREEARKRVGQREIVKLEIFLFERCDPTPRCFFVRVANKGLMLDAASSASREGLGERLLIEELTADSRQKEEESWSGARGGGSRSDGPGGRGG
jgi:hypothetical protein